MENGSMTVPAMEMTVITMIAQLEEAIVDIVMMDIMMDTMKMNP